MLTDSNLQIPSLIEDLRALIWRLGQLGSGDRLLETPWSLNLLNEFVRLEIEFNSIVEDLITHTPEYLGLPHGSY